MEKKIVQKFQNNKSSKNQKNLFKVLLEIYFRTQTMQKRRFRLQLDQNHHRQTQYLWTSISSTTPQKYEQTLNQNQISLTMEKHRLLKYGSRTYINIQLFQNLIKNKMTKV